MRVIQLICLCIATLWLGVAAASISCPPASLIKKTGFLKTVESKNSYGVISKQFTYNNVTWRYEIGSFLARSSKQAEQQASAWLKQAKLTAKPKVKGNGFCRYYDEGPRQVIAQPLQ